MTPTEIVAWLRERAEEQVVVLASEVLAGQSLREAADELEALLAAEEDAKDNVDIVATMHELRDELEAKGIRLSASEWLDSIRDDDEGDPT